MNTVFCGKSNEEKGSMRSKDRRGVRNDEEDGAMIRSNGGRSDEWRGGRSKKEEVAFSIRPSIKKWKKNF